jgi:sulfur-carrier protein adenylyltransferase/sulfurtransferase
METGMSLISGVEGPSEVIMIAYGLEQGLRELYASVRDATRDKDLSAILNILADVEARHQERLFNLYRELESGPVDKASFEAKVNSELMEGGFSTEEFMEHNGPALQTVTGVLNVAMALEAQAMDLYMRYAQRFSDEKVKQIFHGLADEEKIHLKRLGGLMDQKVAEVPRT